MYRKYMIYIIKQFGICTAMYQVIVGKRGSLKQSVIEHYYIPSTLKIRCTERCFAKRLSIIKKRLWICDKKHTDS